MTVLTIEQQWFTNKFSIQIDISNNDGNCGYTGIYKIVDLINTNSANAFYRLTGVIEIVS